MTAISRVLDECGEKVGIADSLLERREVGEPVRKCSGAALVESVLARKVALGGWVERKLASSANETERTRSIGLVPLNWTAVGALPRPRVSEAGLEGCVHLQAA
jgi:hypothetical protein